MNSECILCGGALDQSPSQEGYHWEDRIFAYHRCTKCGARVIQPLPSEADLARMYRHGDYHEAYYEECALGAWPQSLLPAARGARLLDFGCGDGAFLAEARKRGFDAVGVELDLSAREVAHRNSGCVVQPIEQVIATSQRFDVIHLGDVLEHLLTPMEILRVLESLLNSEGVFFIEGPLEEHASLVRLSNRVFTMLKRAAGRALLAPSPPFHLSRTSAASQRYFFERTMGYELKLFEVSETGWPYLLPEKPSSMNAKTTMRRAIGRTAVSFAHAARPFGVNLGNRFVAIAAPAKKRG